MVGYRLKAPLVGVPGSETFDFPLEGEAAASPAAASVRRNSTQRRENDSVSSVLSNSSALLFKAGDWLEDLDHIEEAVPLGEAFDLCRPALSRSSSVHDRTDARRVSISNLFVSPLGVERN